MFESNETPERSPYLKPSISDYPPSPRAQTAAERSKAYRQRRKNEGLKAVKCLLPPDQLLYLSALCELYDATISEAIGIAVEAMITGTMPHTPRSTTLDGLIENSSPRIKLLRLGGTDSRAESPHCEA